MKDETMKDLEDYLEEINSEEKDSENKAEGFVYEEDEEKREERKENSGLLLDDRESIEKKVAEILGEENDRELAESADADVNRKMTASRKQSNSLKTMAKYAEAMSLFNTKRAFFFSEESEEHKDLGKAAHDMIEFRNEHKSPASDLGKQNSREEKIAYAAKWLDKAQELSKQADYYISSKSGLTFAGSDRKKGAKALKELAEKEMQQCLKAMKKAGLSYAEVFSELNGLKADKARGVLDSYNHAKMDDLSDREKTKIYDAVTDFIGAVSSNSLIKGLQAEKEKNGQKITDADVEGLDFENVRWKMQHTVSVALGTWNYVLNNNPHMIRSDMEKVSEFAKAMQRYDETFAKDVANVGKKVQKEKEEQQKKKEENKKKQVENNKKKTKTTKVLK